MKRNKFVSKYKPGRQAKDQNRAKKKKPAPYRMHDQYFQKAKKEWYRARSVYKLIEIQEQFELITPDMHVCDVWAAPGSFIQYIKRIIKDTGIIVGIDLKPIDKYSQKNIHTIVWSIFDYPDFRVKIDEVMWAGKKFDLITSDIAPNTTGRKDVDQYASVELNIEILKFADEFLKKWGNVLLKVFKWEDFRDLVVEIQKRYSSFTEYKPLACRDRSFEEYVICFGKK